MTDDARLRAGLRQLEDQVLAETRNQFERLVFLNEGGQPLLVKDGEAGEVVLSPAEATELAGQVDLITHNHPGGTSFTVDDVLSAIALNAREVNAFGSRLRYRLLRRATGTGWPGHADAEAAIRQIDGQVLAVLRRAIARGDLAPADAEALHRHTRWTLFAKRFAAT